MRPDAALDICRLACRKKLSPSFSLIFVPSLSWSNDHFYAKVAFVTRASFAPPSVSTQLCERRSGAHFSSTTPPPPPPPSPPSAVTLADEAANAPSVLSAVLTRSAAVRPSPRGFVQISISPLSPAQNGLLKERICYVCPEPVLVKRSHLCINGYKRTFFAPRPSSAWCPG